MGEPTKAGQHPLENQCTEVLAWLIDQSPEFARAFVRLFMPAAVVDSADLIGARTQLSLPALATTGVLRPDLSVEGSKRTFHLLVEVKVGSIFSEYKHEDAVVLQPDVYVAAWQAADEPHPARIRVVGTLTRDGGPGPRSDGDPMRGPDVSWTAVRDTLSDLLDVGALPESVRLVAASFQSALDGRVVKPPVPPAEELTRWLDARRDLVVNVLAALRARISTASAPTSVRRSAQFVGGYLPFMASDSTRIAAWVFVTPAGGVCNRPGIPDAICIAPVMDSQGPVTGVLATMAAAGGFEPGKDYGGYPGPRRYFELSRLDEIEDAEARAASVADWAVVAMHEGGLLQSSGDLIAADAPNAAAVTAWEQATGWEYVGHRNLEQSEGDD